MVTRRPDFLDADYNKMGVDSRRDVTSNESIADRWGVRIGPWLWATRLKILFVVDGDIKLSGEALEFGLAPVLRTLRDPSFAWWVRFDVDVGRRDGQPRVEINRDHVSGREWKYYEGFRFTQQEFDIDTYDQVWFFGHHPADREPDDSNIYDEEFSPVNDAELKIIAEWMDRGGGVFAAGDHGTLGASMCSRIPRVRTMRKWKHEEGVPLKYGTERHETLVHAPGDEYEEEGDRWPQNIQPVYRRLANSSTFPFVTRFGNLAPHPLLCVSSGVIDQFPDHMHEGEIIENDDVDLNRPLGIPGYDKAEYPVKWPENQLPITPFPVEADSVFNRPRPQVIAYGWTTNSEQETAKRFAMISVYDGDAVSIGRVVVDSTWHHWFSMNLVGFRDDNPAIYERMQAYYRNVALWLATPAQRSSMLFAAIWGALVGSPPMAFERRMSSWLIGEKALDIIGRTASQCIVSELVGVFLQPTAAGIVSIPTDIPMGESYWSSMPVELRDRAIAGGIGSALLDLALDYKEARARRQRPRLTPNAIRRLATEGVSQGYGLLTAAVERAATDISSVRERMTNGFRAVAAESIRIPVEVMRLRIVTERLQFRDASDPSLLDSNLTLTLRVSLDGSIILAETIDHVKVPAFQARGGLIDLRRELAEILVQTGEELTIEVLAGAWKFDEVDPDNVRFRDQLRGDLSSWLGRHTPGREQSWRLWYRIEQTAGQTPE